MGMNALAELILRDIFPVVYLDRSPLDGEFSVHAVIPIRMSRQVVTFLDPRQGERRVNRRKFEAGWERLGYVCVVCEKGLRTNDLDA